MEKQKVMKGPLCCPCCGREMEPGWVYGKAPLLWSPKQGKATLIRGKEDIQLLSLGENRSFICRDCRKVILEY